LGYRMKNKNSILLTATSRLLLSSVIGISVSLLLISSPVSSVAPLAGWDAAGIFFVASILFSVLRFNAADTRSHAIAEDPGRGPASALLVLASIASIFGVIILIFQATNAEGLLKLIYVAVALASVVVSWLVVHTTFLLSYARQYYQDPEGGIEFNSKEKPKYSDFAYVAFTVGMTFQVSDTAIATPRLRALVLRQALLSYIFGTLIIAATINFLVGLGK